jgi:hypothetical protein
VVPVSYTVGEILNPTTLLPGGFIDQKISLPLCAHEFKDDEWMLTIDKDEFFTCEAAERKVISPYLSPKYYNNLARNFMLSLTRTQNTHVMFGMLPRGPSIDRSQDCINGSFPTGLSADEIRNIDWKMTMVIVCFCYFTSQFVHST